MRFMVVLNMFILHLVTGQADLTISGWSYIRLREGKWTPIKFIDWLFRTLNGQEDHCRKAIVWEINESHKMVNDYRKYLRE